ncbi:MAG: FG-GAP repeat protein [Phycisphaerales bacterium]
MKRSTILVLLILLALAPSAMAQCLPGELQKILADDGEAIDHFGGAVALRGDVGVAGAAGDDDNGTVAGAAYVLRHVKSQWLVTQKLLASDGEAGDNFGHAVACDSDTIFVGALRDDDLGENSGAVYVFERDKNDEFQQVAKLRAPDGEEGDEFGNAVAFDGDVAAIAAWHDNTGGNNYQAGSVYVFRKNLSGNWRFEAKLIAPDGDVEDFFGSSVDIEGGRIVVGAPGRSPREAVYIFERVGDSWNYRRTLTAETDYIDFGWALDLQGDRLLVGAIGVRVNGEGGGGAYMFERQMNDTWIPVALMVPNDPHNAALFGDAVALAGDAAIIGSMFDNENGESSGSCYIYAAPDWVQVAKFVAADTQPGDTFGSSVAVDGSRGLIGAPGDDDNGRSAGAAYIFDIRCFAGTTADLTGFSFARGSQNSGDLDSIHVGDGDYLIGTSAIGFLSSEPNVLDLRIRGRTDLNESAQQFHIAVESRCNNPGCAVTWRLINFDNGETLDQVHSYTLGTVDKVELATINSAADYIRNTDGRIILSIKKVVIATFSVTGFRAHFDHIRIGIQ